MRVTDLRWLPGVVAALALLLAACSGPRTAAPAAPENTVVSIDGMQAEIETSKLDLSALSFFQPPTTSYCDAGQNVAYAQVLVPLLAIQDRKLVPYVDVFWMPRNWNHKLVLYAHGYLDPLDPNWLQSFLGQAEGTAPGSEQLAATRDRVLCQHYAIGLSSYSSPGYAVKEGIIDTHLLNAVFKFVFWRTPDRTYVMGSSLGGLITVALAEQFPNRYDGALPTCGPVGGSLAEFDYIGNVRLLFDTAFGNTVLSGSLTDWQRDDDWMTEVEAAIQSDALTNGGLTFQRLMNTGVTYAGVPYGPLPLLQTLTTYAPMLEPYYANDLGGQANQLIAVNALLHALRYHVVGAGDVIDRGDGSPFSNAGDSYSGLAPTLPSTFYVDPQATYTPDGSAVDYYGRFYQPSGDLHVPTLSLHNYVDPDVPMAHEYLYQAFVDAALGPDAGSMLRSYLVMGYMPDDLLQMLGLPVDPDIESRAPLPYGHCNFRPTDIVAGLVALDHRATYGDWPTISNADFRQLPPLP
ncbi:MAG TPA: hypothetical protein VKB31_03785 [Trueperaceae bacterium]|nr:hypothetical protein [Trueperaceae bacterium]